MKGILALEVFLLVVVQCQTASVVEEKKHGRWGNGLHDPSLRLMPQPNRWTKKNLTWSINGMPHEFNITDILTDVELAFEKWQNASDFRFVERFSGSRADIEIIFAKGKPLLFTIS